jgi:ribonuclease VapC
MSDVVLDNSAIVAVVKNEPGADVVRKVIVGAVVSSVIAAEFVTVLTLQGMPESIIKTVFDEFMFKVEPFDRTRAIAAGLLAAETKHRGLSLGDRACLALAIELGMPVLTSDQVWHGLDLGIEIRLIR